MFHPQVGTGKRSERPPGRQSLLCTPQCSQGSEPERAQRTLELNKAGPIKEKSDVDCQTYLPHTRFEIVSVAKAANAVAHLYYRPFGVAVESIGRPGQG
ncbi:hypothetical protein AGR7A_Lc10004 [Agrobacterium deltaense NCPPB 1641]|uniref:Uncharacterized protein n=1 Tax=Agrobacterium deltaense NCPPB 1641 TaxID=1183425 RepID=A0A1S7TRT4_9HYPH|nr:hypothetical protein AGR7A_Lc10004 [Agrobacterium deltaense NCPPB 1641]